MGLCGGGDSGAGEARRLEEERQRRIEEGMGKITDVFSRFGEPFYAARKEAFLNFALPEYGEQYRDARRQLIFQLARQGLLRSGAAEQGRAALERTAGRARQQIVDEAAEQARLLRGRVEEQRTSLINQLQATGNPALAAQQALSAASQLRLPSAFAPIGQLFQTFTQNYVNKQLGRVFSQVGNNLAYGSLGSDRDVSSGALPSSASRLEQ